MKVNLEREKCISCGSCAALCPKYFEIADDGKSTIRNSKKDEKNNIEEIELAKAECCQEAADACPAQCINIIK